MPLSLSGYPRVIDGTKVVCGARVLTIDSDEAYELDNNMIPLCWLSASRVVMGVGAFGSEGRELWDLESGSQIATLAAGRRAWKGSVRPYAGSWFLGCDDRSVVLWDDDGELHHHTDVPGADLVGWPGLEREVIGVVHNAAKNRGDSLVVCSFSPDYGYLTRDTSVDLGAGEPVSTSDGLFLVRASATIYARGSEVFLFQRES